VPVSFPVSDATAPLYDADRHAKAELKKHLRGVRPIERALEEHPTLGVRGDPRLLPGGARVSDRRWTFAPGCAWSAFVRAGEPDQRLHRASGGKKRLPPALKQLHHLLAKGLQATAAQWSPLRDPLPNWCVRPRRFWLIRSSRRGNRCAHAIWRGRAWLGAGGRHRHQPAAPLLG
jgi:hypothetical protein